MHIDPKVEPWLRALLDGVENSNHDAEAIATTAYSAIMAGTGLVENAWGANDTMLRLADQVEHKGHRHIAEQLRQQAEDLRSALGGYRPAADLREGR